MVDTFPDKEYILNVYEHLQYYYQMAMGDGFQCIREFNLEEFCRKFKYFPVPVDSALKILTQAGYLEYTDEQDNSSRILFTIRRDELYKLREMGKEAEALIQSILRSYTGVFTDYAYISEESLAVRTGLTRQQIYNILVTLTKRRIVDYIPRKKTPYIIYTRERLELRFLHIPPSVYEERKARYEARIKAMEEYVTTENICRSRMLLLLLRREKRTQLRAMRCLPQQACHRQLIRGILRRSEKANTRLTQPQPSHSCRNSRSDKGGKRGYRTSNPIFIGRRRAEDAGRNATYFKISYYICR